jgi:hypothetical protein
MDRREDFADLAREQVAPGLLAEFWLFLAHTKKWWMLPILALFLLMGALIFLSSTPLAPFIYTMF